VTVKINAYSTVFLLLQRAPGIVFRPHATWKAISAERIPLPLLFLGYVLPLTAIGPLARFIGLHDVGVAELPDRIYHASVHDAAAAAAFALLIAIAGVFLVAAIVNALAPAFGAGRSFGAALRVSAYALTPAWLGAALGVDPRLPALLMLAMAVLQLAYTLYLLYLGLVTVMGAPSRRAIVYAPLAVFCAVLIAYAFGRVMAVL